MRVGDAASWFFCDANGVSTARVPEGSTLGKNFAWRSYFHGGPATWTKPGGRQPGEHLRATTLSDVFLSKATSQWIVAISTPVFDDSPERKFLGVVAMTVEVGRFVDCLRGGGKQFAVLVDNREGEHKGVVLQHPLFDKLLDSQRNLPASERKLPDSLKNYRVAERRPARHARAPGELPRSAGGRPGWRRV